MKNYIYHKFVIINSKKNIASLTASFVEKRYVVSE